MKTAAKIRNSLKAYKSVGDELEMLKASGHFALVYASILSIYETLGPEIHKENLMLMISQVVDDIWGNNVANLEMVPIEQFKPLHSKPVAALGEHKISSSQSSRVFKHFDTSLSDFSHISGPGTFSRERKTMRIETSPGPADYQVDDKVVKSRSPQMAISSASKYSKRIHTSPGPGAYTPLYHYRSR
jgi:hypothetical protein